MHEVQIFKMLVKGRVLFSPIVNFVLKVSTVVLRQVDTITRCEFPFLLLLIMHLHKYHEERIRTYRT